MDIYQEVSNLIAESIPYAIDKKSENFKYDKTTQGRITEILPSNKYKVEIQGNIYTIESMISDNLKVNDTVFVTYVQNNFNNKYIIGKKKSEKNVTTINELNSTLETQINSGKYIKSCCLYYGYPQAFLNLWSNDKVALAMSKYDIVVFGDGYNNPSHEQNAPLRDICSKIKALNPKTEIFGYVPIGLAYVTSSYTMAQMKQRVDWCYGFGATGIFLDEFGYDYLLTRERQNEIVSYCHLKGNVIANSWNLDYVFSSQNLFLNNINCNINNTPPVIKPNDYFIFENLFFSTTYNSETSEYSQLASVAHRVGYPNHYYTYDKPEYGMTYYEKFKTQTIALDGIYTEHPQKEHLRKVGMMGSMVLGIDAYGASSQNWGAGGSYDTWDIPKIEDFKLSGKSSIRISTIDASGINYPIQYDITTDDGKILTLLWDIPANDTTSVSLGEREILLNDIKFNPFITKADMINDISLKANRLQESWHTIFPSNGWVNYQYKFKYAKNDLGFVSLYFSGTAGTIDINTLITALPDGYKPLTPIVMQLVDATFGNSQGHSVVLLDTGEIKVSANNIAFTTGNTYTGFAYYYVG